MPDHSPLHIEELHRQVRAFLLATMPRESPASIAAALMYEIASLSASIATTPAEAHHLVVSLLDGARAQIDAFGVGRPHP
jgi:hypothetical protein